MGCEIIHTRCPLFFVFYSSQDCWCCWACSCSFPHTHNSQFRTTPHPSLQHTLNLSFALNFAKDKATRVPYLLTLCKERGTEIEQHGKCLGTRVQARGHEGTQKGEPLLSQSEYVRGSSLNPRNQHEDSSLLASHNTAPGTRHWPYVLDIPVTFHRHRICWICTPSRCCLPLHLTILLPQQRLTESFYFGDPNLPT